MNIDKIRKELKAAVDYSGYMMASDWAVEHGSKLLDEIASLRAERERAKIFAEESYQVDSEIIATLQAKLDKAVVNNCVALATAYQCGHDAGLEAGLEAARERDAMIAEKLAKEWLPQKSRDDAIRVDEALGIANAIRTQP